MANLTFNERVDDAILCASFRLAHLRDSSLRGGIMDFRASCGDQDASDSIWSLRVDRCNALLFHEDNELRTMARTALARE